MRRRTLFLLGLLTLGGALGADLVERINKNRKGISLQGYDPVAYFTEGKAVKGLKEHTSEWNDAQWHHASAENRDLFRADPERYAPQYGGYCAYAVSEGYTAEIDPQAWRIVNDKLYLNYSKTVQKTWERNTERRIKAADANWPKLHK